MKWKIICTLLAGCLLTGCGGINKGTTAETTKLPSSQQTIEEQTKEQLEEFEKAQKEQEKKATEASELVVEKSSFKADTEIYNDNVRTITTLGLKEYNELRSRNYDPEKKKGFLDTPKKGYKYLVLFLSVKNNADEDLYFNVNYLTAKVDGQKTMNTFLLNDPEDYPTIFRTVKAKDYNEGFIVWEVPENWKKMVMTFKGFEPLGGKRLKLTMKREDLTEPAPLSKLNE